MTAGTETAPCFFCPAPAPDYTVGFYGDDLRLLRRTEVIVPVCGRCWRKVVEKWLAVAERAGVVNAFISDAAEPLAWIEEDESP